MMITVVGAGPGIGAAVARRFGREGFRVGLIARTPERLSELVLDLQAEGIHSAAATADATRPDELRTALGDLGTHLGPTDVLCFSPIPDVALIKPVLETSPEELMASLRLNIAGAAAAVDTVLPAMRERGHGTLLFTTGGGALAPSHERAASGITTTAATVYIRMLHDALALEGIHVAHVTIVGAVGPGATHEPAVVAEALWRQYSARTTASTVLR